MKFSTRGVIKGISAMSFVLLSTALFAQEGENLVPNGSFESIDKKPKRLGKIESAGPWVSPTGVRADLFVSGKIDEINVPSNIYGKEEPKDGDNYAGFYAYSYGDKLPRSYVMTKLTAPMKKGLRYCVKFNISLAEASKYASNNISALIAKKMPGTDAKVSIIEEGSVFHFENEYSTFSARYNWTEICGVYEAKGGEKYIAIGNFDSNEETRNARMKKDPKVKDIKVSQIVAAYYYLDDVSVRLIDEENGEKCDCLIEGAGDVYSNLIYQKMFTIEEDATDKDKVDMQQVYFAFGKSKISAEGQKSLDLIAEVMNANPAAKLKIIGHNNKEEDEVGMEKEVYQDMDNQRIASVMRYLSEKGVAEGRLIPQRRGAEIPNSKEANSTDDEEMVQAKDRRVEFQLK